MLLTGNFSAKNLYLSEQLLKCDNSTQSNQEPRFYLHSNVQIKTGKLDTFYNFVVNVITNFKH